MTQASRAQVRKASVGRTAKGSLRLGLCCQFASERVKFRTTTATAMLRPGKRERLARLAELKGKR